MADAKSNEATLEALESARTKINNSINVVRDWQTNNNGADYSTSAKAAKIKLVADLDSDSIATELATAKNWVGTVTS